MSMRYGAVELSIPPGFQNILWMISQEVLRVNPDNPLEFIAGFMDDLLAIRAASGYDPVTQGDMITRVQEQYWRVQRERQNSKLNSSTATAVKKPPKPQPETNDGSGDIVDEAVSPDRADFLVTLAVHQDQGEGTCNSEHQDEEMQEEAVAKQQETEPVEQEGDTIQEEGVEMDEGQQGADDENTGQDQDNNEGQTDQAAIAAEEKD